MTKYDDILDMPVSKQEHQLYLHQQLSCVLRLIPKDCGILKFDIEKSGDDVKFHSFSDAVDMSSIKTESSVEILSVLYMLFLSYCKKNKVENYAVGLDNENIKVKVLMEKNKEWNASIYIKMEHKPLPDQI